MSLAQQGHIASRVLVFLGIYENWTGIELLVCILTVQRVVSCTLHLLNKITVCYKLDRWERVVARIDDRCASDVSIVKVMTVSSEMSIDNFSRLYIRYEASFLIVSSMSVKSLAGPIVVLFLCKVKMLI
jgi:hypothetical protein